MASVTELFKSRDGASRGTQGVSLPRRFMVVVDSPDDDPIAVMLAKHPIGSQPVIKTEDVTFDDGSTANNVQHWNFAAIVSGGRIVEQRTQTQYICELQYIALTADDAGLLNPQLSPIVNAGRGWSLRVRSASIPVDVTQTLSRKSLGLGTADPVGITIPQHGTGPLIYKKFSGPPTSAAPFLVEIGEGQTIPLEATTLRETAPIVVDMPAALVELRTRVLNFQINKIDFLARSKNKINSMTFLGADPGHIILTDFAADPVPSTNIPTQFIQGLTYDLSLSFLWSSEPHSPKVILHRWEDPETGGSNIVETNEGVTVSEEMHILEEVDFNGLLTVLAVT